MSSELVENAVIFSRKPFNFLSPKELAEKTSAGGRVLIVEDDLSFKPFWESVLSTSGFKLAMDWATSKEEAERLIRHRFRKDDPYDLVISDIWLEGEGTGIDLWNQLGEAVKNFVFISGLPISQLELLKSLNFGCPSYLHKPLSPKTCRELIRSLVA